MPNCAVLTCQTQIRQLLRKIHRRGHEIGLHPSYETFRDPQKTAREFRRLLKVCAEEQITQERWGGRQHYLRWQAPITWLNWEHAGLDYDTTVGHAEHTGFRCGTCYDFPAFDLGTKTALRLRERPLIVMEVTLFSGNYMGLDYHRAQEHVRKLIATCRRFGGEFVLLWHNSNLLSAADRVLYEWILDEATVPVQLG